MGGGLAFDAAGIFAVFLILVVLAGIGIALRRVLLERGGGTIESWLRQRLADGSWQPWRLGIARYQREELRWYRAFGVTLRPDVALARRGLVVTSTRPPGPTETVLLGDGTLIVECREVIHDRPIELAMGEAALTGFRVWLEAAPPGSYFGQIA